MTRSLVCRTDARRRLLIRNDAWNGLDYLDVADDQLSLCVHFFNGVPEGLGPQNFRISGGARIRDIQVVDVALDPSHDEELDDCLRLSLDRPGDFSTYTLCLVDVAAIDPRFACLEFSFKVGCASDLDCADATPCPPDARVQPDINYLAKDYASFAQLIYDRMAVTTPDWRERHVPDLGVTLVELLAYVGDHLSYYQDAVATEAYLDTARQRISVRRHLRLIDYQMHEGCNARAFVTVDTENDFPLDAADFFFVTASPALEPPGRILKAAELPAAPPAAYEVFEPVGKAAYDFQAAQSKIAFHDWGDGECCVPKGATRATLVDHVDESNPEAEPRLRLGKGDYLIFEEVLGPRSGRAADADPAHRHVVRLTKVTPIHDALLNLLALDIEWDPQDALPFALCVSSRAAAPDCDAVGGVSVARGNVVLVDHGRTVHQAWDPLPGEFLSGECACEGSVIEVVRRAKPFDAVLEQAPLTFTESVKAGVSATAARAQDPRAALPAVDLLERRRIVDATTGEVAVVEDVGHWSAKRDLLESDGDDRAFVAEIDDAGAAHLRFGDGVHGRQVEPDAEFSATYRVGNGRAGNVGREAIARLVLREGVLDAGVVTVRNPLAAAGGTEPEPTGEARMLGPGAIQGRRERAIIAADYAELAARDRRLQGAAASLRWTGSWREARVALDPLGTDDLAPGLADEVAGGLHRYRRIGHDLAARPGRIVPLRLAMHVCVLPHYTRAEVKAALLDVFSSQRRANGALGFFHPDRWRFGQSVYLSQIVAAAVAVDGVETVKVTALTRLNDPGDEDALDTGRLVIRAGEIARLDRDPNFPENGALELDMGGGR